MKTRKLTNRFVEEVKSYLDENYYWDFEACNSRGKFDDCEKAVNYLSTQKFSTKVIREAIEVNDNWEALVVEFKSNPDIDSFEEKAKYTARYIANELAYDRISRFTLGYNDNIYTTTSKKWYIDETVSFKIA